MREESFTRTSLPSVTRQGIPLKKINAGKIIVRIKKSGKKRRTRGDQSTKQKENSISRSDAARGGGGFAEGESHCNRKG